MKKPLSYHGWAVLEVVQLPFLGKAELLIKTDRGCFCYCYCWSPTLLSGRRKQNQVPKTSTCEQDTEKKSKAGKQLLELSRGEASMLERGSTPLYQRQASSPSSTTGSLFKALLFVAFLVVGSQKFSYINK